MENEIFIRPKTTDDKWVEKFIIEHWASDSVVVHDSIYFPLELEGFVAFCNNQPAGLITYKIVNDSCEIVTLDSIFQRIGIGSALIQKVKEFAEQSKCKRLWLVTTNDNVDALLFYQKVGFVLVRINRNAVDRARKIKPSIPLYGIESIPIRDEIELEILLNS